MNKMMMKRIIRRRASGIVKGLFEYGVGGVCFYLSFCVSTFHCSKFKMLETFSALQLDIICYDTGTNLILFL
jgi:hypothetical protein